MADPIPIPRCGDAVYHRPTGETWLVAYADPARDELGWSGWPEGYARLSDCELKRVATDEQHAEHVRQWVAVRPKNGYHDMRRGQVLRLYGGPIAAASIEAGLRALTG